MNVGEYSRISEDDDRNPLYGKGIGRQQADTGTILRLRDWQSGGRYADDDLSAFKVTVERPEFERMVDDLESGKLDGIVGYDVDRLFRQPSDLERVIRIYDERPGLVFATVQGDINLMTSDGRTMARVLVAFANKSSMDTSRRVSRQKLERAMNGESTSNFRAYGWNDDGTLHPEESATLLQAITDVLEHKLGLYVICDRINEQGLRTVRGNTWKTSAMRRVLTAPRIAGLAVYKNEVLLGEDGQPIKGTWTPLVDEATWHTLVELLRPRKGAYPVRKKKYLLSGILRCGLCGMGMVGGTRETGRHGYLCRSKDSGGCAKVGIAGQIDSMVVELVLNYLDDHEVEQTDTPFTGQERLDEIGGKIAELMAEYRGGLPGGIVFPNIKKLEEEQRELQTEKAQHGRSQRRVTTTREEWPGLEVARQQAIIREIIEAVVVRPGGKTGFFDPSRARVVWKEEPQSSANAQA